MNAYNYPYTPSKERPSSLYPKVSYLRRDHLRVTPSLCAIDFGYVSMLLLRVWDTNAGLEGERPPFVGITAASELVIVTSHALLS